MSYTFTRFARIHYCNSSKKNEPQMGAGVRSWFLLIHLYFDQQYLLVFASIYHRLDTADNVLRKKNRSTIAAFTYLFHKKHGL